MSDNNARAKRRGSMRRGAGGMVTMMVAMWIDPSAAEADEVPPRFTTATLVLWTLAGIALAAAISGIDAAFSGDVAMTRLVMALAMVVPLVAAFGHAPPRKLLGLTIGLGAGAVAGLFTWYVANTALPAFWAVFWGLALGSLVASFAFGLLTRRVEASGNA